MIAEGKELLAITEASKWINIEIIATIQGQDLSQAVHVAEVNLEEDQEVQAEATANPGQGQRSKRKGIKI
jgi:hypothetical protein